MKLSVSLPEEDVAFLDRYVEERRVTSRSAAVHDAVKLLRASALGPAYEQAWTDWADHGDAESWDSAVGDGLS